MNNLIRNKIGEKYLSIWWFLIIAIISGGIVAGVLIYYGADVDVRGLEADILSNRIADCLNNNGYLSDSVISGKIDIIRDCNLSEKVMNANGDFYARVRITDDSGKKEREDIVVGNVLFEKDCGISSSIKAKNYPKCVIKKENLVYFDKGNEKLMNIEILAGSNQYGRKYITQ